MQTDVGRLCLEIFDLAEIVKRSEEPHIEWYANQVQVWAQKAATFVHDPIPPPIPLVGEKR